MTIRTWKRWSDPEVDILRNRYPDEITVDLAKELGVKVSQVYHKAEALGVKKSPQFIAKLKAASAAKVKESGKASRFRQGVVPWNKGIHWSAGGRSPKTRYKTGDKPHSYAPIGSERVSKEGYLQRKVTDTGYPPRDWVPVHHLVWQEAGNGPVPDGYALCFRDGSVRNLEVSNLELVSRSDLMRRNSIHNYGPEVSQANQLLGCIRRQINARERGKA